ncbi:DUF4269 domain-containing protein, partial [Bacillus sp. HC-TM]
EKQQKIYDVLNSLNIMEDLALYNPVLCGTIPIRIDTPQSDLDIVIDVNIEVSPSFHVIRVSLNSRKICPFKLVLEVPLLQYIKVNKIKGTESIKVNFEFEGFEFELFAQPKPVRNQNAYRHMIVEHMLLMQHPHIREEVIHLKEQGLKTEPAFAQVLNIDGDPYEELILLGDAAHVINA